jgi:hypothetical protein
MEDASFRRFGGARFAGMPAGVSARGAVVEPDELPVEFSGEVMFGVVAQI